MAISNFDNIIDSRDIIRALRGLEDERQELLDAVESAKDELAEMGEDSDPDDIELAREAVTDANEALGAFDEDEDQGILLVQLREIDETGSGYAPDWRHGEPLIRDDYFETYARDRAEDFHGDSMANAEWPFDCIDWEKAAKQLQADYTSVDFGGVTYWVRS